MDILWVGCWHKTIKRSGFRPEAIVVHIMEGTLADTDARFNDKDIRASAHYAIGKNGKIHQYVMEQDTAWHAPHQSVDAPWELVKPHTSPDLYTIGIKHEGFGADPWPSAMYDSSAALVRDIAQRWNIPVDRYHVIGHREIDTSKACPGDGVDLDRLVQLAQHGLHAPVHYNFVPAHGTVEARMQLNVRKGAPTTSAEIVRKLKSGSTVSYVGWTSNGQAVDGNAHWYKDEDGNYFWAGGTVPRVPSV